MINIKKTCPSGTIGDYLARELAAHGVRQVFGYPGAAVIPLMESIDKNPNLTWITTRNEANAALAASACAKLTGSVSVCVATSGPGATNLVTGLADAQADRAPLVAITGMIQTWRQGRFDFQDLDAARLLGQLSSYSVQCSHPQELPAILRECLGRSQQERCLTHIALPVDIQKFEIPSDYQDFFQNGQRQETDLAPLCSKAAQRAVEEIGRAKNLVIAVGPWAREAGSAIEQLAEKLQVPILTAFNAKAVIRDNHPNRLGVLGIFGAPGVEVSRDILSEAELVLAFGLSDLAPFVTGHDGAQKRKLVQCEPTPATVTHSFHRQATTVGDLQQIADHLGASLKDPPDGGSLLHKAKELTAKFRKRWNPEQCVEEDPAHIHPVQVLGALSPFVAEEAIVALDIGDNAIWASQFLDLNGRQKVVVSENMGAMGFCLPACIAAGLAEPGTPVVGIAGDGGIQMSIGELATAVQHKIPFVLLIFSNHVLGRIQAQESHPFQVHLHNPDWVALARAYGADGAVLDGSTSPEEVFKKAFQSRDTPFLIDVRLNPKTQAPVGSWNDGFCPLHYA